jgi:hypothetical protein
MKGKLLEELQFSVGIVLGGEEVVPRFRVICHDGDWTIFVPLSDDIGERQRRMQLVYGFMAWKSAVAFVMSSELKVPDCVIAGGGCCGFGALITSGALTLSLVRRLGPLARFERARLICHS